MPRFYSEVCYCLDKTGSRSRWKALEGSKRTERVQPEG